MSTPSLLVPPAETDLKSHLKGLDHSNSSKWQTLSAPTHLSLYPAEGTLVTPFAKSLTKELTSFLKEYFWRVNNTSQADLFATMFIPMGTYYHRVHSLILAGHGDFAVFGAGIGHGPLLRESIWLRHCMDRVAVLPSVEEGGSVLVYVLRMH
jgi:hypothetical protein